MSKHANTSRVDLANDARINGSKRIARAVASALIDYGCTIHIWNGGDEPEIKTNDKRKAYANLWATDEETIIAYKEGRRVGFVSLIYGNASWETVSDYTDSEEMNTILAPVFETSRILENTSLG